jgi:hypothetical protein
MVKAYLRYQLAASWGVISSSSNVVYDEHGSHLISSALENILIWNVKQAAVVRSFISDNSDGYQNQWACILIGVATCAGAHTGAVGLRVRQGGRRGYPAGGVYLLKSASSGAFRWHGERLVPSAAHRGTLLFLAAFQDAAEHNSTNAPTYAGHGCALPPT